MRTFQSKRRCPPHKRTAGVRPNLGLKRFAWSLMSSKGSNVYCWTAEIYEPIVHDKRAEPIGAIWLGVAIVR